MNAAGPHYLLFSLSDRSQDDETGRWRFVLRARDGSQRLEATDTEPGVQGERLELLSIVRGLEALEQPSRVTLVTPSPYVREGIRRGLFEWRHNGWRWESFGRMVPVKDLDLWQRVDRALEYHNVDCRLYRLDRPHLNGCGEDHLRASQDGQTAERGPHGNRLRDRLAGLLGRLGRWVLTVGGKSRRRLARLGTALNPCLWFG